MHKPNSQIPRILIADDEPLLRAELHESLTQLWPQALIVGEAGDGYEALRMGQELAPDIAFLDIRMPGLSGLEVASTFGARTHVVFVTAYQEHAIAAFEQGALDYLLKPSDPLRLARTIQRVRARLGTPPPDLSHLPSVLTRQSAPPSWIQAAAGNTVHFIDLDTILYFCAETKYTCVVAEKISAHIRTPLKELADSLENAGFWQIHRSYVVAVKRIANVSRDVDGLMWLSLRDHAGKLPVSQRFQHRFKGM